MNSLNQENHKWNETERVIGSVDQVPKNRQCNCRRSNCLKLYCECFATGVYCASQCNCGGCFNNFKNERIRHAYTEMTLVRNPNAFRSKVQNGSGEDGSTENGGVRHFKGCQCKKSFCLKKYCECFQAKMFCTSKCRCVLCKNVGVEPSMPVISEDDIVPTTEESRDTSKQQALIDNSLEVYSILNSLKSSSSEAPPNSSTTPVSQVETSNTVDDGKGHSDGKIPDDAKLKEEEEESMGIESAMPPAPHDALLQMIESTPGLYTSLIQEADDQETQQTRQFHSSSSSFIAKLLNQSTMDEVCFDMIKAAAAATEHCPRPIRKRTANELHEDVSVNSEPSKKTREDVEFIELLKCDESINNGQLSHLDRTEVLTTHSLIKNTQQEDSWSMNTTTADYQTSNTQVSIRQHLHVLQHLSVVLRGVATSLTERRGGIPPYR